MRCKARQTPLYAPHDHERWPIAQKSNKYSELMGLDKKGQPSLLRSDLTFDYPEDLVATEKNRTTRVMMVGANHSPIEITLQDLLQQIQPGDVLILNDTKVLARRVFSENQLEILFLDSVDRQEWQVLFPSKKFKEGDQFLLPGGVTVTLKKKGRPQVVWTSAPLDENYFETYGELPLPPYIQKARQERHNRSIDRMQYQTSWAKAPGSFAAPTASLHFSSDDLSFLRKRNVHIKYLTLHVGLGTFLPVEVEDLSLHKMHSEFVCIPIETIEAIESAKKNGHQVWALGTTVTRSLESYALGFLKDDGAGYYSGSSDLMIVPGFEYKIVDVLMTNFHQPESTLLALVFAFAGQKETLQAYRWAIENQFKLFSYGDLSVWRK